MRALVFDLDQTRARGEVADWALWLDAAACGLGVPVPEDEDGGAHPIHTDHGLLDSLSWKLRGRPFGAEAARSSTPASAPASTRCSPITPGGSWPSQAPSRCSTPSYESSASRYRMRSVEVTIPTSFLPSSTGSAW